MTMSSSSFSSSPSSSSSSVSVSDLLTRLSELPTRAHLHSSRARRACVAIILRIRHNNDVPFVQLRHAKPKVKVQRVRTKPTTTSAPPNSNTTTNGTSHNSNTTQAHARNQATHTHEVDVMTRMPSTISPAGVDAIRASLSSLASQPWTADSQLELVFMQRAKNPNDRWSGQMSFPGGRQEKGETDEQTVIREVREEIGWNLDDSSQFVRLGQLDDKPMDGLKNVKPLAVGIFVFLQVCRHSPPLILEPTEVSSILFVPLTYFHSIRSAHDFGRIYHPLMLQILARHPAASSTSATAGVPSSSSSSSKSASFDLKLIGWPHKREGRPMTRAGLDQLSNEDQHALDKLDDDRAEEQHISELDEAPFTDSTLLTTLRTKVQTLAHELPFLANLPQHLSPMTRLGSLHLPFLPRIEQLASLRFPALSLPGVWVDANGRGGYSTGDDIRTEEYALMQRDNINTPPPPYSMMTTSQEILESDLHASPFSSSPSLPPLVAASQCPPPFILWGMTLEKSFELSNFLGFPFGHHWLARGSDRRRRKYQFWASVGEARWGMERQVEGVKARFAQVQSTETIAQTAKEQVAGAPLTVPAFTAPTRTTATTTPTTSSSSSSSPPLVLSSYSTPALLARLKHRASEVWSHQKEKIRSRL